jgi:proline iminopeptidase
MKTRLLTAILALSFALVPAVGAAQAADLKHPPGKFVTVMGKKIWYEIEGQGEPLLLIPGGGGGSHDYYHPYFSALSRSFRVVYYDGFGRGNSDRAKVPSEYSLARDVEEVEELRKALGLEKIHVLGHSYGGFVAQGYAVKYPGSVRKLVLANTFVSGADYQESNDHINGEIRFHLPEIWSKVEKLRARGSVSSSPEMQEAYFAHIATMQELFYFYDPANASKIVFNEHTFNTEEYYAITGPDSDFQLGGEMLRMSFGEGLASFPRPILILIGRADGIVPPRLALKIARHARQGETVIMEKSGHFPFIEETSKTMEVIEAFLRK